MKVTIPTDVESFNYEERFNDLASFLSSIRSIWQDEILHHYPNYIENYPQSWIDELDQLTEQELYLADARLDYKKLEGSEFAKYVGEIHKLCHIPQKFFISEKLPSWAFNKVKEKKQHEINILSQYVKELQLKHQFNHIVDIGGGVGHLARILSTYYGLKATSIDQDERLQSLGKKRVTKYPRPEDAKEIRFINATFGNESPIEKIKIDQIFEGNVLNIGLHTCGPLALNQMRRSINNKSKVMLNFACCYNKLDTKIDVNLSDIAKKHNHKLTNHALTLATRGHNKMSFEDYLLKKNVKRFRYTLHLLLNKKFGHRTFLSVGEENSNVYKGSFSKYALDKLKFLKIEHDLTNDDINSFFNDTEIKGEVHKMFLCNVIRWQLGRVMELYILIDRVLWMNEQGYKVDLSEFFNSDLSPRNIGLTATLK